MFWDVFGKSGHPVRATISDMGPLLLSRMLGLNDTQEGVLNLVFRIADDHGLLLLDSKDLRAMLQHVGDNAAQFTTEYGNVSAASIGAIQRGLLALENQGATQFFGEPMLNIADLMQTADGKGVVNILAADQLMNSPKLYGTFLLWMLSELFEHLPEVGDPDKPKLVFFFDEAHLLFNDAPKALLDKIEQVVRLIRSKGVGVYFVTQNPLDIPDTVLGQLGNRVQHALRAFTPRDQKAVKSAAETMRPNPKLKVEQVITELEVGEALVSFLDDKGRPNIVERAFVVPPGSQHRPDLRRRAPQADRVLAGLRPLREGGGPRVGLRKAERPHRRREHARHKCHRTSANNSKRPERRAVRQDRPARRQAVAGPDRGDGQERGAHHGLAGRARNRARRCSARSSASGVERDSYRFWGIVFRPRRHRFVRVSPDPDQARLRGNRGQPPGQRDHAAVPAHDAVAAVLPRDGLVDEPRTAAPHRSRGATGSASSAWDCWATTSRACSISSACSTFRRASGD